MVQDNEELLCDALGKDLHKPKQEAQCLELENIANMVRHALAHLDEWVQDEYTEKTLLTILDDTWIHRDPLGVVLVLAPWNYPVYLALSPLIGAVSAGNAAIIKPSELAPHSAEALEELVPRYLDPSLIKVVTGGIPETTDLLKVRFDHIFFTGSPTVGKIVAEAASKHLTPCTLELGGKSPLYIDDTVDMAEASRRILWGKMTNLGQTCVAPDYVLCSPFVKDKLVEHLKKSYAMFYEDVSDKERDTARIVNERNYNRLQKLLLATKGKIVLGGTTDSSRLIDFTAVVDVDEDDALMSQELFGPILPILTVGSAVEAIDFINAREKPLALYIFSLDTSVQKQIIDHTSSGSVCCNDVMIQLSVESLPFGGVGNSGYGHYHGKFSYDTFSHPKAVLRRTYEVIGTTLGSARFPPYSDFKTKLLVQLAKSRKLPSGRRLAALAYMTFGAGSMAFFMFLAGYQ